MTSLYDFMLVAFAAMGLVSVVAVAISEWRAGAERRHYLRMSRMRTRTPRRPR